MRQIALFLGAIILLIGKSFGQTDSLFKSQDSQSTLSVNANIAGVKIFIDSNYIGVTPINCAVVADGIHKITAASFHSSKWNNEVYVDSINIPSNGHIDKYIFISKPTKIITEPFNAMVYKNDSLIGKTPLSIDDLRRGAKIKFKLDGYRDSTIINSSQEFLPKVFLQRLQIPDGKRGSVFLDSDGSDKLLPVYITGGTAIISGITAAYCKIQADKFYKEYQITKNKQSLDRVKRLDAVSGISLAVSQVSIAILSYLLFNQ